MNSMISFNFRDRKYILEPTLQGRVMKRITTTDTAVVTDIKKPGGFQRLVNDHPVNVPDTMAVKYSNSINSVHYFAYLPYGLNDRAVNKELLGEVELQGKHYYKVRVTFDQEGGGKDYEDVFLYWFNKDTFKADYLAYTYGVDGGGVRFREAYNERYIEGIRFVDYLNYEPSVEVPLMQIDSLYLAKGLHLLSRIELKDIQVSPGSYN